MAMLRNMVTSLIEHERIVTTLAKAKEVQRMAEKVVTMAKRATVRATKVLSSQNVDSALKRDDSDDVIEPSIVSDSDLSSESKQQKQLYTSATSQLVHAHRQIGRIVRTDVAVQKVMNVLRHRYDVRVGGYTRILKLAKPRAGDNANMAIIEYVDHPNEVRAARPPLSTVCTVNDEDGTPESIITTTKLLSSMQLQQQLQTLKNMHATTTDKGKRKSMIDVTDNNNIYQMNS
jgi:large subunit ribosomal protein L17